MQLLSITTITLQQTDKSASKFNFCFAVQNTRSDRNSSGGKGNKKGKKEKTQVVCREKKINLQYRALKSTL